MKKLFAIAAIVGLLWSCGGKQQADLIIHNATVYTVNDDFNVATAFAVKDGKFVGVGSDEEILKDFESDETINLEGQPVYPGLIDAHAHFYRYGLGLKNADLVGTNSFEEILEILKAHREKYPDEEWIVGNGWDQNDWENKEFPTKAELDEIFPDVPVFLTRVDSHAALANSCCNETKRDIRQHKGSERWQDLF